MGQQQRHLFENKEREVEEKRILFEEERRNEILHKQDILAGKQSEMKRIQDLELKEKQKFLYEKQRAREETKLKMEEISSEKVNMILNTAAEADKNRELSNVQRNMEREKIRNDRMLKRNDREETVQRIAK